MRELTYKVGDKVLMNPKSMYANQAKGSSYGLIVAINELRRLPYKVAWKNKEGVQIDLNSYGGYDLLSYPIIKRGDYLISSEGIFTVVEIFTEKIYIIKKDAPISEALLRTITERHLNTIFFKVKL